MQENNPANGSDPVPADPPAPSTSSCENRPDPGRWKRRFRVLGIFVGVAALMGAAGLGGAEYYTSRPDFCGTCHVMGPYYDSWTHDVHGAKLDVWCVECHYAPGEQHTIKAKFKGLSQLASYFSGRYGTARPRAHVDDASCLRSGCHGDQAHMTKSLLIGEPRTEKRIIEGVETEVQRTPTVRFVHGKHLDIDDRKAENRKALTAVASRLKAKLPASTFERVERAARSVLPAAQRQADLRSVLAEAGAEHLESDALEMMRLEHTRLRLDQLAGINCSACHGFDAGGARHFVVDRNTCFTCHFMNQAFNRDTGECLRCHEPPVRNIVVHGGSSPVVPAGPSPGATQAPAAMMNHLDIVNRGVDCGSCHYDVVRGQASVTERECAHCHDQERFTADFASRDTEIVAEYHRIHVARQRAKCPDCHRTIEHRLVDPTHVGTSAGFLEPVLNDCRHCHPNHHSQQVHMLMGTSGLGVDRAMPNAMFGSRLNCRACHTQAGSDFTGAPLIAATQSTCVRCHGEDYRKLFDQWISEINNYVREVENALARADERIKAIRDAGGVVPEAIIDRIEQARRNYRFVKVGNGIHNKNYSMLLLDNSLRNLDAAIASLSPN